MVRWKWGSFKAEEKEGRSPAGILELPGNAENALIYEVYGTKLQ